MRNNIGGACALLAVVLASGCIRQQEPAAQAQQPRDPRYAGARAAGPGETLAERRDYDHLRVQSAVFDGDWLDRCMELTTRGASDEDRARVVDLVTMWLGPMDGVLPAQRGCAQVGRRPIALCRVPYDFSEGSSEASIYHYRFGSALVDDSAMLECIQAGGEWSAASTQSQPYIEARLDYLREQRRARDDAAVTADLLGQTPEGD